ncbi:vacuolar assembly protein DID2 [Gongronella butleri]|nr:vacuolar assembly protein DID2 [Gongronella butleri]
MGGLENQLFQIKFTAKQLQKQSKRCQKEETQERQKLKKAMEQGHQDIARIHAENAIRKKNDALNLLRLASRVDAVASRVQSAITMRAVSSTMTSVVKNMDKSLNNMDLEKIAMAMDKFETQVDALDVQEHQMMMTGAVAAPSSDEVEALIQQTMEQESPRANADADVLAQLDQLHVPTTAIAATKQLDSPKRQDDRMLEQRLQALRH